MQALRSIDLQTRSVDLHVFVYITTDKTPLLCQNPAVETRRPPAMAPTVGGGTHHGATVRADPTALSQTPLLSVSLQRVGVIHTPVRQVAAKCPPVCATWWDEPPVK